MQPLKQTIKGTTANGFEAVQEAFAPTFTRRGKRGTPRLGAHVELLPNPRETSGDAHGHPGQTPTDRPQRTVRQGLLGLTSHPASAGTARHFAAVLLRSWGVTPDDLDSAVLVVGELTANTALYGRADTSLFLSLDESELLIVVTSSGAPVPHRESEHLAEDEHGRGTGIVEFLAHHMEIHKADTGCRTYATLRVTTAAKAA
ncbi:ATP-binding protein [Streptomyces sp. 7N604]|uniref:ATP-binding protein n=1 Tax=Streptomyces sp. 7N604 TaxID=3457415 RepID=UPI003FCFDB74